MSDSDGHDFYKGNYYDEYDDSNLSSEVSHYIQSETPKKPTETPKKTKKEEDGILTKVIRKILQEFEERRSRITEIKNPKFIKRIMKGKKIKKISDVEILALLNDFFPTDISNIIIDYMEPEYWKCNYHSYSGTSDVYGRIINGEISFLLWVLTELDKKNTQFERITREEYTIFLESLSLYGDGKKGSSRKDHNKRVNEDFCAVVASDDQKMSSFKTRIIVTKEYLLQINDKHQIPIRLPYILGDITQGLDKTPWTIQQHKDIVNPFIKGWDTADPLNKKYCNFEVE